MRRLGRGERGGQIEREGRERGVEGERGRLREGRERGQRDIEREGRRQIEWEREEGETESEGGRERGERERERGEEGGERWGERGGNERDGGRDRQGKRERNTVPSVASAVSVCVKFSDGFHRLSSLPSQTDF